MYAIINHKGKQHKVAEGEVIYVDKLGLEKDASIAFNDVLYMVKDDVIQAGNPYLDSIKVIGEVMGDIRDKKVIAFTYRRRKSSSRKVGHRQTYSCVKIKKIEH